MTVNSIEHRLLELLADAETPLYSAWRWLQKQTGIHQPLDRFLELVNDLIDREQIRLWCVDFESHDRTEFFEAPGALAASYANDRHDDESYDPYGYSLTLGPKADIDAQPEWEVDINLPEGTFQLLARDDLDVEGILRRLARYFPELSLLPTNSLAEGGKRRVIGRVSQ